MKAKRKRKVWPNTTPERRKMAHALRDARYYFGKHATRAQKIEGAALSIRHSEAITKFVELKIATENFMHEKLTALARAKPGAARLSLMINGDTLEMTRRMIVFDDTIDELREKLETLEEQVNAKKEAAANGHDSQV